MVQQLEWGISPDREVAVAWGARAIYKPGVVDLLWDRQCCVGGTEEERERLGAFLNEHALPRIRKMTKEQYLGGNEDRRVDFQLHGWYVCFNPRGSYGYLYIGVWPVDNGIPGYVPPPAPPPTPEPKPRARKAKQGRRAY